jgi:hypothetical protein
MADPIEKFMRDFNRYTGDGLPNEPVGYPLPSGDPSSGAYVPTKAELRAWATAIEELGTGTGLTVNNLGPSFATRAIAAAKVADGTLGDGQHFTAGGVEFQVKSALTLEQSAFNVQGQAGVDFVNDGDRPIFLLCIGQSNMRSSTLTPGGDYSIPDNCYAYNNGQTVPGTKFRRPIWGNFPFDSTDDGGTTYNQSLPLSIMRALRNRTNRPIYMMTVAKGDTLLEGWIKDATLTANGWSRGTDTDMTPMLYPGVSEALAQVPGNNGKVDIVAVHQGEANSADSVDVYRAKFAELYSDLVTENLVNKNQTIIAAGGLAEARSFYFGHKVAMSYGMPVITNMRYADSSGLTDRGDGTHFTGESRTKLGERYADAILSPNMQRTLIDLAGTFTPNFADATSGGNVAPPSGTSGAASLGRWERQGRVVTVTVAAVYLNTNSVTSGNSIIVQNLPFRVIGNSNLPFVGAVECRRITLTGVSGVSCYAVPGTTNLRFRKSISANGGSDVAWSDYEDDLAILRATVTYVTDQ